MAISLSLNQGLDVPSFFSFEHIEDLLSFLICFLTLCSVHFDIALQPVYEFSKVGVRPLSESVVARKGHHPFSKLVVFGLVLIINLSPIYFEFLSLLQSHWVVRSLS